MTMLRLRYDYTTIAILLQNDFDTQQNTLQNDTYHITEPEKTTQIMRMRSTLKYSTVQHTTRRWVPDVSHLAVRAWMSPDVRRDFQINKKAVMSATSGRALVVIGTICCVFAALFLSHWLVLDCVLHRCKQFFFINVKFFAV